MAVVKFNVIRENSEISFRFLMIQTINRLELAPCGDKKETRKRLEEELFTFLQRLPQGKYLLNNAGINHIGPSVKDDVWLKNKIPARFRKQDSQIPETILVESLENSQ